MKLDGRGADAEGSWKGAGREVKGGELEGRGAVWEVKVVNESWRGRELEES